ncbi:hypothetical protein HKX48_007279 [Thoreauomyces humboldtii]|nr:hypothetical protein HKX48_007279 [Thoreauomyces humboldtii]
MTSVVAFAAGKVVSAVSAVNAFYSEVNPSTLSGAIDVVVIKHTDGDLVCSPFHVRFGKLKLLRPHDKAVTVTVNGEPSDLLMKLGEAGEAFFVIETENPVPSEYATSPIQHAEPTDAMSMEPLDLNAQPSANVDGAQGEDANPMSPSRINGYHSAHGSDIQEDEFPLANSSKKTSAELLEPPTGGDAHVSSKSSAKGSDLPIDADDVAHLFEHDARMVGMIQTKGDKMETPQVVVDNAGETAEARNSDLEETQLENPKLILKKASSGTPAKDGKLRPRRGNNDTARSSASNISNNKSEGHPSVDTNKAEAKAAADLPIDAEDVTRAFAHDARLVGMTQKKDDHNPASDGTVETTPPKSDEIRNKASYDSITAQDSISQVIPPPQSESEATKPSTYPRNAGPDFDSALCTPSSVLTDDPMIKTASRVASALGSQVDAFPLHALSASASNNSNPTVRDQERTSSPLAQSLPTTSHMHQRRRSSHTRSSSVHIPGEDATAVLVPVDEAKLMPNGANKRNNNGPLSDTEVEYTSHEADAAKQRSSGWNWGWGGLPKKGSPGVQSASNANTTEPMLSVDEKVTSYLAGLPESQPSYSESGRASPTKHQEPGSPEQAPVPHGEELTTSEMNIAFRSDIDMALSLVGYDKISTMPRKEADEAFEESVVSFETFCKNPELLAEPSLVFRISGNYYSWAMAAPMIMANLAFKKPLPSELVHKLNQHHARPGQLTADNRKYSFNQLKTWWTRGSVIKPAVADDKTRADADIKSEGSVRNSTLREPIKEQGEQEQETVDPKAEESASQHKFPMHFAKSLRLTSEQLKQLDLKPGPNTITFAVNQSGASVSAKLFLYDYTCKIVISDIDGTITKSDALGHIFTMVGKDWTHSGIASLYTNIRKNGYHILYLTSRAIGQAGTTREYLSKVEQGGFQLPEGPVIMSPDRLFASFHREVILRKPEEFKMACLRDIKRLFVDRTPFYAGFGNRITDALSYRSVDVPSSRIFTIDSAGEVKLELLADYKSSYVKLNDIVDQIFPHTGGSDLVTAEYNDWNYWRSEFPKIEIPGEEFDESRMGDQEDELLDEDEYTDDESYDDEDEEDGYADDNDVDVVADEKRPPPTPAVAVPKAYVVAAAEGARSS